jgi:HPt (histidine-containing phosphotransfer) domain-containing protein
MVTSLPFDPDDLFELLSSHWQTRCRAPVALRIPAGSVWLPTATGFEHLAHLPASMSRCSSGVSGAIRFHRPDAEFAEEQRAVVMDIRGLLVARDIPSAQRRAHSLKGLAGTLGMPDVQAQAATLEAEIKHAGSEVEARLQALDGVLAPLLDSRAASPATPPAGSPLPVADKMVRATRTTYPPLAALPIEGDGEAETCGGASGTVRRCFSLVDAKRLERRGAWDPPVPGYGCRRQGRGDSTKRSAIRSVITTHHQSQPDQQFAARRLPGQAGQLRHARPGAGVCQHAGSGAARHHDAGNGWLRSDPATEGQSEDGAYPGHLPYRQDRGGG